MQDCVPSRLGEGDVEEEEWPMEVVASRHEEEMEGMLINGEREDAEDEMGEKVMEEIRGGGRSKL